MKSEKKITCVIIILIAINIIYYKIAKGIQREHMKIFNNQYSNHINKGTIQSHVAHKNDENIMKNYKTNDSDEIKTDALLLIDPKEIYNSMPYVIGNVDIQNNFKKEKNDLIKDIGQNYSDGLKPIPMISSNLIMTEEKDNHESSSTHLKSFLIILAIITITSLCLVAYQEYNAKNRELFNANNRSDEYYLLNE